MPLKKIVVIGPESTGKSSLCAELAAHYHTAWCPEYAREFLLRQGMNYTYEDLLTIARSQIEMEENYIESISGRAADISGPGNGEPNRPAGPVLFIDTDMYVMKVWCEFVFGKCHTWILDQIAHRKYDLYLLCNTDLAWVRDELREYPDLESRQRLFHIYKDAMVNQKTPWIEISGDYQARFRKAVQAVDKLLDSGG